MAEETLYWKACEKCRQNFNWVGDTATRSYSIYTVKPYIPMHIWLKHMLAISADSHMLLEMMTIEKERWSAAFYRTKTSITDRIERRIAQDIPVSFMKLALPLAFMHWPHSSIREGRAAGSSLSILQEEYSTPAVSCSGIAENHWPGACWVWGTVFMFVLLLLQLIVSCLRTILLKGGRQINAYFKWIRLQSCAWFPGINSPILTNFPVMMLPQCSPKVKERSLTLRSCDCLPKQDSAYALMAQLLLHWQAD